MDVKTRTLDVRRHGDTLHLNFPYNPELVATIRTLPFAVFNSENKTWTAPLSTQAIEVLRKLDHRGLTTVNIDTLIEPDEDIKPAPAAILRATTSSKRPWAVHVAGGDDVVFSRLRAISGALWDKKSKSLTYPSSAGAALADAVKNGLIVDTDHTLSTHDATIAYDTRKGQFQISDNPKAEKAFNDHFPTTDVVTTWKEKQLDVGFLDPFSESMYRGELVRAHGGDAPEGLTVTLFPYQSVNAAMAAARDGFAIFDEPGLGKTISAIAAGMHRLNANTATRVVIVCPAAVRTQWSREIYRATGHTDISVITGDREKRHNVAAQALAQNHRWVIVHYDVLTRDVKQLAPVFSGAYVVADEAHRIKSPEASRTKTLRKLSVASCGRLALTGTPVETNPAEWFDILSGWVSPGVLGTPIEFNERYRWPNRWGGYEGARNVNELRKRSEPLYIRHTKSQVAQHLPPLRVQHLPLDPDVAYAAALRRAHADAAEEIRNAANARLEERTNKNTGQSILVDPGEAAEVSDGADMTAISLLRLLCTSPRLIAESEAPAAVALMEAGLIPDADGPKLDHLRVIASELKSAKETRLANKPLDYVSSVEEVTGERMVVFTCSKRMANLVYKRLEEDGVKAVLFTGDTKTDARDKAVADFTDPTSDVQIFICTDAGAEGLNLGKCCSLLVNLDLAWTAARMSQRAQRIHRVDGTAPKYLVVNMTLTGTVEAGILRLLEERADLTDALLGEEGTRSKTTGRGAKPNFYGKKSLLEEALSSFKTDPVRKLNKSKVKPLETPKKDVSQEDPDEQLTLLG